MVHPLAGGLAGDGDGVQRGALGQSGGSRDGVQKGHHSLHLHQRVGDQGIRISQHFKGFRLPEGVLFDCLAYF